MTTTQDIVLIIDDTPANLGVLFDHLEKAGFKVLVATSGEAALEGVKHILPDIILLDVIMPGIDGFETCRHLKANEATKDISIIFMTALGETIDEVKGFQLGAVDYIIKPVKIETVLARVNTHLTIRKLQKILQEKNTQLQEALDNVRTLKELLPICSNCKSIRDDEGYWHRVENYISEHSDTIFSHGICPDCIKELYPEYYG